MRVITRLNLTVLKGVLLTGTVLGAMDVAEAQSSQPITPITFEQIYASPDDLELTLAYAKQQAGAGDYLSAMGALEALLFANPNWDSARIFYTYVLFKLDDQGSVEREITLLETRPLTQNQKAELNWIKTEIRQQANTPHKSKFAGRMVIGAQYDDNAGNALSDRVLSNSKQGDVAAFVKVYGALSVPIGTRHNRKLKLTGHVQSLRHETFENADYDVFNFSGGYQQDILDLTAGLDFQYIAINIDGQSYLKEAGPRLQLTRAISEKTVLRVKGLAHFQAYKDLPNAIGETFRSGQKYTLGADVLHQLMPHQVIKFGASYDMKDAKSAALIYDGINSGASFKHSFKDGTYLLGTARYRHLKFKNPIATTMLPLKRKDHHVVVSMNAGVPLNVFSKKIGMAPLEDFENLSFECGVSFEDRRSNIPGFEYENFGTQLKLIWNF